FTLHYFLLLPGSLRSKPPRAAVYSGRRELTSLCFEFSVLHESSRPAVGRHRRRTKAGHRPRQAPEAQNLQFPIYRRQCVRRRRRRSSISSSVGGIDESDAKYHDSEAAGIPERFSPGVSRRIYSSGVSIFR
ncbi:hypothetical protein LINPERHAP1_LOCUS16507, partial [Linum perenne]